MAHLLVIDDDPDIRRTIRFQLESAGHTVVEAVDGQSGLVEFRRAHVDIVITDIFMPGQEGIETIIVLKKLRPALKIIAISGSYVRDDNYLPAAKALGADSILAKPFRRSELLTLVSQCLEPSHS